MEASDADVALMWNLNWMRTHRDELGRFGWMILEGMEQGSDCRQRLMHNVRTYYGTINGVLTMTSDCCVGQLDRLVGSGVYTCRDYSFIKSSDHPPQLSLAEIELATARMQAMIDQEDRRNVH